MVDSVRTATVLEHNPACHQAIDLAFLSPPLPRATSTHCFLHDWRHPACLVHLYADHCYLSVPANSLLLAAARPRPLHRNNQLLYHTCLPELSYRRRHSDSADSLHLAHTDPKEQEALALCGIPTWFIVRPVPNISKKQNRGSFTKWLRSVCVTGVIRLQTLTGIDNEDITCQYPSLRWAQCSLHSIPSMDIDLQSATENRVQRLPRPLDRH